MAASSAFVAGFFAAQLTHLPARLTSRLAAGVVVAAPFYLLLIDTADLPELLVIPVIVVLAAIAVALSSEQGITEVTPSPRLFRRAPRALLRVPLDIVLVCRQLGSQLRHPQPVSGQLRTVPFAPGDGGADLARAALTESLGSFAPNTIVIGVDLDQGVLLVHQLRPHGGDSELDLLRLG